MLPHKVSDQLNKLRAVSHGDLDARVATPAPSNVASSTKPVHMCSRANGFAQGFPPNAPSLLSRRYLAAWGDSEVAVGATTDRGWSADEALAEVKRSRIGNDKRDVEAVQELAKDGSVLWEPL